MDDPQQLREKLIRDARGAGFIAGILATVLTIGAFFLLVEALVTRSKLAAAFCVLIAVGVLYGVNRLYRRCMG